MASRPERSPRLPPRWFIRLAWKAHRALYRVTGGRRGLWPEREGKWGTMRVTTVGRRTGEPRDVGRGTDVVRVEVRDHDARHRAVDLRELRAPARGGVGQPEARVDDRPPVVAREQVRVDVPGPCRERQRDAADAAGQLLHGATLRAPATTAAENVGANALHKRS